MSVNMVMILDFAPMCTRSSLSESNSHAVAVTLTPARSAPRDAVSRKKATPVGVEN